MDGLLLDYSKNRINKTTIRLLHDLARHARVEEWRARLFAGEKINFTEGRAVLHTALRNRASRPIRIDGDDVMPAVNDVLSAMRALTEKVRAGDWRGHGGKPVTDVVNIGIGGSDLGPRMATAALAPYHGTEPRVHFVSNIDGADLGDTLARIEPATSLFIIASKNFTTEETMTNAASARSWLVDALGDEQAVARHFVAVSASPAEVRAFGIPPENMFEIWDWVGGRYSLWSAIGLPVALAVGMDHFEEMLAGAHAMDEHFRTAPLERNLPVLLALIGIWNRNFLGAGSHAVLPYDYHLRYLPAHLQQVDMESNGKVIRRDGARVDYATGPIVWGQPGTDGQHAFFQLLHQGTEPVSADFIAAVESPARLGDHHDRLLANFLAQTAALAFGKTSKEVRADLKRQNIGQTELEAMVPHRTFEGNRPSTSILIPRLSPSNLGRLIALYEHKIFVQGVIWAINSFDQWGVELGKQLSASMLPDLRAPQDASGRDASSNGLINHIRRTRDKHR